MANGQHDTIAYRLSQILIKLNQAEKLDPEDLAQEFGVHVRTIQRDLRVRLAYLPLTKIQGRYQLSPAYLGKLNYNDIERFAALAGVKGLFPSLSAESLRSIFDKAIAVPWLVKGHHYEDLSERQPIFRQLEAAVMESRLLDFEMVVAGVPKAYKAVAPYRLLNLKGIWYLAAVAQGKYKTFGIGKMLRVVVTESSFHKDPALEITIAKQEGAWHSEDSHEVMLSVAAPVASYFKRRQLVPNQIVKLESSDGSLQISTTVGHPTQILPIVRYWLPHIRIVYPAPWQESLERGLEEYLAACRDCRTK